MNLYGRWNKACRCWEWDAYNFIPVPDLVIIREKGPLKGQWRKEVSENLTAGNNKKALLDRNENTETSKD